MYKVGDVVLYINTKEKRLKGTNPLRSFIGRLIKITNVFANDVYIGHTLDNENASCQIYGYELTKKSIRSHLPKWW